MSFQLIKGNDNCGNNQGGAPAAQLSGCGHVDNHGALYIIVALVAAASTSGSRVNMNQERVDSATDVPFVGTDFVGTDYDRFAHSVDVTPEGDRVRPRLHVEIKTSNTLQHASNSRHTTYYMVMAYITRESRKLNISRSDSGGSGRRCQSRRTYDMPSMTKPRPSPPIQSPESDIMLPTEIWLQILENLPGYALEPVSRVCKCLRRITLPFYFREQLIFPFLDTFAFRRQRVKAELFGYQERSLLRIQFLSSGRISAAVKELFVSPYPPGYNRRHGREHGQVESVMRQLILVLPRFSNLQKLVLRFTPCDDATFLALRSLDLESFELELSSTARGEIPIPARKEFVFNHNTSLVQMFSPDALHLAFIFPGSIERVATGPTGTDAVTRAILHAPSGLPSLHTLDLAVRFVSSSDVADTLAACPNLATLRLRTYALDIAFYSEFPPISAAAVPHLTYYHGPARYAPVFARGRTLRTVCLWSSHSVSTADSPWDLLPILAQLGPTVTHLELGVVLVPRALLAGIRDAFPVLATLAINAHFDAFNPGSVDRRRIPAPGHVRARLALPVGLRPVTVRLGVQLTGTEDAELCAAADKAIATFPGGYDPTAWRLWVVDRPWHCVEWVRVLESDVHVDGGREHETDTNMSAEEGTLSIEYGEHYFQGFERGVRITAQSVEEAMARMTIRRRVTFSARKTGLPPREWAFFGLGLALSVDKIPSPADRLASPFVGLASPFARLAEKRACAYSTSPST
ncbi:hypothetical protein GGX14DRAFT_402116 [Mycena pura]|uniref:F-box domain-containing protein n=1 Tax=Mycena pura TaxID=153505 RepID=A0AAD6V2M7_9AGAR|nr:hypothetical protein GGX14DRAFT_402116 [Mycena pura]